MQGMNGTAGDPGMQGEKVGVVCMNLCINFMCDCVCVRFSRVTLGAKVNLVSLATMEYLEEG